MSKGMDAIERAVERLMERSPRLTKAQATQKVIERNPSLYDQYLAQNPAQTVPTRA